MRGAKPFSLLAVLLVGCVLHGLARLAVVEGEPPLPQPTAPHAGPPGLRTLRPSGDAALRSRSARPPSVLALIDPDRREAETENDQ